MSVDPNDPRLNQLQEEFKTGLLQGNTKPAPSIEIPAMTGDPLQDAINLQWALQNALNSGTLPANERSQAWSAYTAASDDVARLMKERETWNAQQTQLQAKYGAEAVKGDDAPPVSGGYQWNVTTGRYDIPIGGGDPIDIAWKNNLDRIEQQQRINKLLYPERPTGTGQARETAEEAYAKRRAEKRADLEAMIEELRFKYENGYAVRPAELQALEDASARMKAELDQEQRIALAEKQSQLRTQEWEETERPYKEAAERRAQAGEERAGAQLRMGALEKQAETGQDLLGQMVKAGVSPTGGLIRMAFDPQREAMEIARRVTESMNSRSSSGVPLAPVEGVPLAPVR